MTIGDRIKQRRLELKMTLKEVAEKLGVTDATVQRYESGSITLNQTKIGKIAEVLKIDPNWLMGWYDPNDLKAFNVVKFSSQHPVPVYGTITAGFNKSAIEEIIGTEYTDRYNYENCFWLRVEGKSMEPEIHEGDYVLIDTELNVNNGDIVAARIDDDDGTIKRYLYENGVLSLIPINTEYNPMLFPSDEECRVRIVGKVVEIKRKY